MNTIPHVLVGSGETGAHTLEAASSHDILYAEDDAGLRNVLACLLRRSGYRVQTAEDGEAAWEALRAASYDLLITDNEMPRLPGLELVKRLRSVGQTLPVIFASGSIDAGEADCAVRLRVAATLRKPFSPQELLETVEEVLRAASGVQKRGELFFPVLAEAFAPVQSVREWGINE